MTHSKRVSRQISVKSEETDLSDAVPTELQSYSGKNMGNVSVVRSLCLLFPSIGQHICYLGLILLV